MIPAVFRSAADGIAREQALLAAGKPALLLWQAEENALVVPANWSRRHGFAGTAESCARLGWPVIARSSGGGGVPQGPGTLNLAIVTPALPGFTLEDGYDLICGAITEALARFEIPSSTGPVDGSFCDGKWNVTAEGRKLGGTAQRWRLRAGSRVALIHAALLLEKPTPSFWTALDAVHRIAAPHVPLHSEVHVSLRELLPEAMHASVVSSALARAAEDRLTRVPVAHALIGKGSPRLDGALASRPFFQGMKAA